jgi:TatD DNase family protein
MTSSTLNYLIDTHAHINFPEYKEDRDEMMRRAYDVGVSKILHSCCRVSEINELINYSYQYDGNETSDLYIAFGVHPTEFKSWTVDSKDFIRQKLKIELQKPDHKVRAIGETGLDYYHCKNSSEHLQQQDIFRAQIEIAREFKLPIIVHTRDAWEDTLKILQEYYPVGSECSGTIHCFTGDLKFAQDCIERGFYISWSGIVTFKNSKELQAVAKKLPLEKTLLETDCPFLAPQARRGKRNEPSYVKYVAEFLAELKGVSLEEIQDQTSSNAEKLFKF